MQSESYLFNVNAQVTKFSIVETGKRINTVYQIDVKLNNKAFYLKKRFKDFDGLNSKLKKKSIHLPDLPSKHLMSRSSKLLENRRNALNFYLTKLLETFNGNLPIELVEFLELIETNNRTICIDEELDSENMENEMQNESNYPLISVQDADFKKYTVNDIIISGILSELYS